MHMPKLRERKGGSDMPAIVKLNKKGLAELIDNIKASGGDTTELENLMAEVSEDENARRPVRRMGEPTNNPGGGADNSGTA